MTNPEHWFTQREPGKYQINSITIYADLYSQIIQKLDSNVPVNDIVLWMKSTTRTAFQNTVGKEPETGALNNAIGRWNEFINQSQVVLFSLPNSDIRDNLSSGFLSLFNPAALEPICDSIPKIYFSSPDFVIAVLEDVELYHTVRPLLEQKSQHPEKSELHKLLKGRLNLDEVKAAVSLKTSNRPDRRYQPAFEATMIKAISCKLQLHWKYYMVVSELTSADRTLFESVLAPHSIVTDQNDKLVDDVFIYRAKADLVPLVEAAIASNHN
jgi:hypothetical protein